jgi:hypothetical protein
MVEASMGEDFEQQEYFALSEAITEFDRRLLTIKGWGVSLSLVALGLGFQYRAYGFLLIAGASSLAFWATEAVTKRHQMRNYVRIREIEVNRYWKTAPEERAYSAPRMNWSCYQAKLIFLGKGKSLKEEITKYPIQLSRGYIAPFVLPGVALPHSITFAISMVLYLAGHLGYSHSRFRYNTKTSHY